jgi:hypothetical protein
VIEPSIETVWKFTHLVRRKLLFCTALVSQFDSHTLPRNRLKANRLLGKRHSNRYKPDSMTDNS